MKLLIKYKNLYIKDTKSGTRRERKEEERKYGIDYIILRLN